MTGLYLFARWIVLPLMCAIALAVLISMSSPWPEADLMFAPIFILIALIWGGTKFIKEYRDAWK